MGKGEANAYRFNLVDFFIVVALIFAICTIVFVILGNDILDITKDKLEVNYILSLDSEHESSLSVDDELFTKKGRLAGKIISKSFLPDGRAMIIVSALSYEADGDLFIKGQLLAPSESFDLRLGDEVVKARCEKIVRLEG